VGCAAAVGASQQNVDNTLSTTGIDKAASELIHPVVALAQLIDEMPDGAHVILYQAARTVGDVEEANAQLKVQVNSAQTVAADVARLHAAAIRSCQDTEISEINAIALKAKAFSITLARVDSELAKSLATMRQKQEAERPASIRAKEEVSRLSLAAHELGRLRVQSQEITRTVEGLGVSLKKVAGSCSPMLVPALFAEPVRPANIALPPPRPSVPTRR